ncbi:hypothetical protein TWF694_009890 [Orbilia ellipsospora]|uniref:Mitochondrial ribosomal protein subunit S18 n=1 Tax=Orbilia ellipsospora TaxID=2528407 RepID=A0AAV9XCK0_9PEZI
MASTRSIPRLLRTARASISSISIPATSSRSISSTSISKSTPSPSICSSPCRPSLANRFTLLPPSSSSFTKRFFADDGSPPDRPLTDPLMDIMYSAPGSDSKPITPSPIPADPTSAIPQRRTTGGRRIFRPGPGSTLGRGMLMGGFGNSFFDNTSEHPAGATILDPWAQLFHLHIYSTKHNTHVTFTDPKKNAIISCSTGILGFRKANRHSYDAAYQLAAHVFQKIEEKGLIPKKVEVVLRGFGIGREACMKALLGKEGRYIRDVVVRITDATRTKFGGTRSKGRRRL